MVLCPTSATCPHGHSLDSYIFYGTLWYSAEIASLEHAPRSAMFQVWYNYQLPFLVIPDMTFPHF